MGYGSLDPQVTIMAPLTTWGWVILLGAELPQAEQGVGTKTANGRTLSSWQVPSAHSIAVVCNAETSVRDP